MMNTQELVGTLMQGVLANSAKAASSMPSVVVV